MNSQAVKSGFDLLHLSNAYLFFRILLFQYGFDMGCNRPWSIGYFSGCVNEREFFVDTESHSNR